MSLQLETSDLLIFSPFRWSADYQRPHFFASRFASYRRVYFFEEPLFERIDAPKYVLNKSAEGVHVVTPVFPQKTCGTHKSFLLTYLLNQLIEEEGIEDFTSWYYSPKALGFSRHLDAIAIVYDCMEEYHDVDLEQELMDRADLILTSTAQSFEIKKDTHHNVHLAPDSVDIDRFSLNHPVRKDPPEQAPITRPRIGFFGMIDERINFELVEALAEEKPEWNFIFVGPRQALVRPPSKENIYYIEAQNLDHLPRYIANWDVNFMPYHVSNSTKLLSVEMTPQYIATGKPLISTPMQDLVCPYGIKHLIYFAESVKEFIDQIEAAISDMDVPRLELAAEFLNKMSWRKIWERIARLEWMLGGHRAVSKMRHGNTVGFALPEGKRTLH